MPAAARRDGTEARSSSDSTSTAPPPSASEASPFDLETVRRVWPEALAKVPYKFNWRISQVEPADVVGSDLLVVAPRAGYNGMAESVFSAETADALGAAFQRLMERPVRVQFRASAAVGDVPEEREPEPRRTDALTSDPLVQKVVELFEARPVQMDYDGPEAERPA